jgi:hypothetical protein
MKMMKKRIIGLSLITLTIMLLATVSFAAAEIGENATIFPDINSSPNGIIWWFKTEELNGVNFDGRDIDRHSIVAAYNAGEGEVIIRPLLTLITKEYVMLVFCPRSLPPQPNPDSGQTIDFVIAGTLKKGDFAGLEFRVFGPGFGRGARP